MNQFGPLEQEKLPPLNKSMKFTPGSENIWKELTRKPLTVESFTEAVLLKRIVTS